MMTMTNAAQRWIGALSRWYASETLAPIISRAEEIARERGATRLGRVHLEMALEELTEEEAQHSAQQMD